MSTSNEAICTGTHFGVKCTYRASQCPVVSRWEDALMYVPKTRRASTNGKNVRFLSFPFPRYLRSYRVSRYSKTQIESR